MLTFDCSLVRDVEALVRTVPSILNTRRIINAIGIDSARPGSALKLWFVIRTYGLHGLQQILRSHIMARQMAGDPVDTGFQILARCR
jgi:aromatic-L-amino-acid decarboxylase